MSRSTIMSPADKAAQIAILKGKLKELSTAKKDASKAFAVTSKAHAAVAKAFDKAIATNSKDAAKLQAQLDKLAPPAA